MRKSDHPLYKRWAAMMARCFNIGYKHYVGDRMTVCRRWQNFDNYASDIEANFGLPSGPEDKLLRKDAFKDFALSNTVGWASQREVSSNRQNNFYITYKGQRHNLSEWARITGINSRTIWSRIHDRGYTVKEAFTKPPNRGNKLYKPNK
jgi:hypothetical protein